MIVIGIVGSPAGGKSTVASRLQAQGATWINADLIAREVLERQSVQDQLIVHFGKDIADNSGQIDRGRLASRVFGDDDLHRDALNYLESVVHPLTRHEISSRLNRAFHSGSEAVILDVPLLFESGWDCGCDEVWCIDAPVELRRRWASDRGWSAEELARRERNQLDIEEKKRLSTLVIVNDDSRAKLNETIDHHWSLLRRRQTERATNEQCPNWNDASH